MAVANKGGNGRCDCDALNEQINELAAQVENCNQRERDECEKKNEQAAVMISSLQRKLTVFQIAAVVAVTILGKELTDKIMESVENAQAVVDKVEDIAKPQMIDEGSDEGSGDEVDPPTPIDTFQGTDSAGQD